MREGRQDKKVYLLSGVSYQRWEASWAYHLVLASLTKLVLTAPFDTGP